MIRSSKSLRRCFLLTLPLTIGLHACSDSTEGSKVGNVTISPIFLGWEGEIPGRVVPGAAQSQSQNYVAKHELNIAPKAVMSSTQYRMLVSVK